MAKVKGDCIEWEGAKDKDGYGSVRVNGVLEKAHRRAYGPVIKGAVVMHDCDNPGCVNPFHLRIGSQADNLKDMRNKGRQPRGSTHGMAKLSKNAVLLIRELFAKGRLSQKYLAGYFGITSQHVSDIVCRRKWKHL